MQHIMRTFKAQSDCVEAVKEHVRDFVHDVREQETGTLSCEVFQDKARPHFFINVLLFENDEAEEQHTHALHTQAFLDNITPLCEKAPEVTELAEIE